MKRNKSKKPYTASEIARKIETGDMHPVIGEQRIKKKVAQANAKRAIGQKIRWQTQRMKPIEEHLERIRTEVSGYRGRYYAYKSHLSRNYEQIIQAQHDLLEQHRQNYEQAKQIFKDEIKPRIPNPTDSQDRLDTFLVLRLSDYFTPLTDAKVVLHHTVGMFHPSYDMTGCLVTTKNDKWWKVVEDRHDDIMVVPPNATKARPQVMRKSSITGVTKPKGEAQ